MLVNVSVFALALALTARHLLVGCSNGGAATDSAASSTITTMAGSGKPEVSSILDEQAQVSTSVLTIAPGVSTGLHKHDASMSGIT